MSPLPRFCVARGKVSTNSRQREQARGVKLTSPCLALPVSNFMRLVLPTLRLQSAFLEMVREYEAHGDHRYTLALQDFPAYLRRIECGRRGEDLPEGWVPAAEFWLEERDRILGCVRIRLELTSDLVHEGGHVGYDIRPSERRRGYGTALLRLALIEARSLGLDRIRVTCDDDNIASVQVIERNGGILAGRAVSKRSGKAIRQYWFE